MTTRITWTHEWDTGLDVIDQQHRRIVEYINQLHDARTSGHEMEDIRKVVDGLVDYTLSHFAFEENLQEEANYPFLSSHKKVHELFVKRVNDFRDRCAKGENVTEELNAMLVTWLRHHIQRDDADYVKSVRENMHLDSFVEKKKGFFSRLFG